MFRLTKVQFKRKMKKIVQTSLVCGAAAFPFHWFILLQKYNVGIFSPWKIQVKPSRYSAGIKSKLKKLYDSTNIYLHIPLSSNSSCLSKDKIPETTELLASCLSWPLLFCCFLSAQWELFFVVTLATGIRFSNGFGKEWGREK